MKDERLITFVYVFQSRDILVFHPVSLIFYRNRPFIFQWNGLLSFEGLTSIKQKSSPCTYAFTQNGCKGTTFFRNSQTKSPFCKLSFSKMQKLYCLSAIREGRAIIWQSLLFAILTIPYQFTNLRIAISPLIPINYSLIILWYSPLKTM